MIDLNIFFLPVFVVLPLKIYHQLLVLLRTQYLNCLSLCLLQFHCLVLLHLFLLLNICPNILIHTLFLYLVTLQRFFLICLFLLFQIQEFLQKNATIHVCWSFHNLGLCLYLYILYFPKHTLMYFPLL